MIDVRKEEKDATNKKNTYSLPSFFHYLCTTKKAP